MNYLVYLSSESNGWKGYLKRRLANYQSVVSSQKAATPFETMAKAHQAATHILAKLAEKGVTDVKWQVLLEGTKINPAKKSAKKERIPKGRAARMTMLKRKVAKAAAGSAYNKSKRRPKARNYIARGTSLAASNAFQKWTAKLHLNPTPASVERLRKVLLKMGNDAAIKCKPGDAYFDSSVRAMEAFSRKDYRAAIRAMNDARLSSTMRAKAMA